MQKWVFKRDSIIGNQNSHRSIVNTTSVGHWEVMQQKAFDLAVILWKENNDFRKFGNGHLVLVALKPSFLLPKFNCL